MTPSTFEAKNEPEELDEPVVPLTAAQVQALLAKQPRQSLWQVVGMQLVVGVLISIATFAITSNVGLLMSVAYGAAAVIIPTAVFVRGLNRQRQTASTGSAIAGFAVWEMVKILLTIALLVAAPKLVSGLSWLALVAGFVVTLKVYWLAVWLQSRRSKSAIR